jgi:hypothetical protein
VRHDGRADDADREQQRLRARQPGHHRVPAGRPPIDRGDQQFDEIGNPDRGDETADRQFERTKAKALQAQHREDDGRSRRHADRQRQIEQQREADRATEKFGKVGCHRGDFADDPHRPHDRRRKQVAA